MVAVQVASGKEYEGILHTGWWEEGVTGVCLKQAKLLVGPNDKAQPHVPEKTILREDFVQMTAVNVDIYNDELREGALRGKGAEVLADTEIEISGGRAAFGEERDLVAANAEWLTAGDEGGLGDGSGGLGSIPKKGGAARGVESGGRVWEALRTHRG